MSNSVGNNMITDHMFNVKHHFKNVLKILHCNQSGNDRVSNSGVCIDIIRISKTANSNMQCDKDLNSRLDFAHLY